MANSTTSNAGTFLTVPANSRWNGVITLAATLTANIGTVTSASYPAVTVSGTGADLADGDVVLLLALSVPTVTNASTIGVSVSGFGSTGLITIQSRAEEMTFSLAFGAGVTAAATAVGGLI